MLNDFFGSARGPGVIGVLFGVVVLGGFSALALAIWSGDINGDNSTIKLEEIIRIDKQIEDYTHGIDKLEALIERGKDYKRGAKKLEKARENLSQEKKNTSEKSEAFSQVMQEFDELKEDFTRYRSLYRKTEREGAKGEMLDALRLSDGSVYEGVIIRMVDMLGMRFTHKNGGKTVTYEELPENLQDRFQFSEEEKQDALAQKEESRRLHNVRVQDVSKSRPTREVNYEKRLLGEKISKLEEAVVSLSTKVRNARTSLRGIQNQADLYRQQHHDRIMGNSKSSSYLTKARQKDKEAMEMSQKIRKAKDKLSSMKDKLRLLKRDCKKK